MNVNRISEIERILAENGITASEISEMVQNGDLEPICIESMDDFSEDFRDAFKDKFCTLESFYGSYNDDEILDEFVKAGNYTSILKYVDERSTKDPNGEDFVKVGVSYVSGVYTIRNGDKVKKISDPNFYQNLHEVFLNFYTPIEEPKGEILHRYHYMNSSYLDVIFEDVEVPITTIDNVFEEMTNPVTRKGYRISKNDVGYSVTRFHIGSYGKKNLDIKSYKSLKCAQKWGNNWIV